MLKGGNHFAVKGHINMKIVILHSPKFLSPILARIFKIKK